MAKKRPSRRGGNKKPSPQAGNSVSLAPMPGGNGWEFRHPRCARDRAEDIEEVRMMLAEGEWEVAQDELRWLLSGCSDCLDAHLLLGELAVEHQNDIPLARGHFGYAYQLGYKAWRKAGEPSPVPGRQLANQGFFAAGRGSAWCLEKLGKGTMANEIVATLLKMDPSDPLECRKMLDDLRGGGGLPML